MEQMVKIKRPVVLVGESGISKTATTQNFLKNLNMDTTMMLIINFSSQTTSMDLQRNIEAGVEKRTKKIYDPPMGKRLLVFMDDLNKPRVDENGTQQHIALLKEERGGHSLNFPLQGLQHPLSRGGVLPSRLLLHPQDTPG